MTDPRPICPIPPDARVGDIVVFRDGQKRKIEKIEEYEINVEGMSPGGVHKTGKKWEHYSGKKWECVGFECRAGEPKRTQAQRDAAWLRKLADECCMTEHERKRMMKIADRMEGKT